MHVLDMQYDFQTHNTFQSNQRIRFIFYVMQRNHKNIFVFSFFDAYNFWKIKIPFKSYGYNKNHE